MYVRCTESKSSCFEVGGIYTVDHLTGDELNTQYIKDEHGDSRTLDLDSDDFEYIPPVTYRVVDDFLAEQEDEDDDD